MGSGSSKVVIKKVTPEVAVNYDAVNGLDADEGLFKGDVNTEQDKSNTKEIKTQEKEKNKTAPPERAVSPQPEEQPEDKPYESETLKDTEQKLKELGFNDPILSQYCDEEKSLFEEFTKLHKCIKKLKKALTDDDNFVSTANSQFSLISSAYGKDRPQKIKKGEFLAAIGFGEVSKDVYDKLIAAYPNLLTYDHEKNTENKDDPEIKNLVKAQSFLSTYLVVQINYSDLGDAINLCLNKAGMVPIFIDMVKALEDCIPDHEQYMDITGNLSKKTVRGKMLSRVLGTLHNMSKRVPTRASFYAHDAVQKILPLTSNKVTLFATKALLILAYLIDEKNNELIMANTGPIKFLITILDKALKVSNHRYLGFSSAELAEGLTQIAINDKNKKMIVSNNVLPIVKKMLEKPLRDEETSEALELLWVLAFDDENADKIRKNEQLVEMIKASKDHEDEDVKKAASGVLWEIEGKQAVGSSTDLRGEGKRHVMISYQWDVQRTLIQVKNKLQRNGYKVWMDLEQMGGSTLEAMAKAVENSAVVLVCVSQKYKESSNCRSEAEYAFSLKKDIVPLMMESNYRPDGWLGMIMGSKLWFDFSLGQQKLDGGVKDLIKELGARGKVDAEDLIEAVNLDTVDAMPTDLAPKLDISGWRNKDVMTWIKTFGLEVKKKNSLKRLDGPFLTRLQNLRMESPDYFYASIKEDIGIYDVYSVLKFADELEKLVH